MADSDSDAESQELLGILKELIQSKRKISCEMYSNEKEEFEAYLENLFDKTLSMLDEKRNILDLDTLDGSVKIQHSLSRAASCSTLHEKMFCISLECVGYYMNVFYGESVHLTFSIFNSRLNENISEEWHLDISRSGHFTGAEKSKAIFHQFKEAELTCDMWLVCKIYRRGTLKTSDYPSTAMPTISASSSNSIYSGKKIKRPLGISIINIGDIWEKKRLVPSKENIEYLLKIFIPHDENEFADLFSCIVDKKEGKMRNNLKDMEFSTKADGLRLNIHIDSVDKIKNTEAASIERYGIPMSSLGQLLKKNPLKNSYYLHINSGEFSHSFKSVKLECRVLNSVGEVLSVQFNNLNATSYESCVFYKQERPKWNEIVKITLDYAIQRDSHIFILLKQVRSKDKGEIPIGFAFIPLCDSGGKVNDFSNVALNFYKYDEKLNPLIYLNYRWNNLVEQQNPAHSKREDFIISGGGHCKKLSTTDMKKTIEQQIQKYQLPKESLKVSLKYHSLVNPTNSQLIEFLDWRNSANIHSIIDSFHVIPDNEICMFFKDLLQSVFALIQCNQSSALDAKLFLILIKILVVCESYQDGLRDPMTDEFLLVEFLNQSSTSSLIGMYEYLINSATDFLATTSDIQNVSSFFRVLKHIFTLILLSFGSGKNEENQSILLLFFDALSEVCRDDNFRSFALDQFPLLVEKICKFYRNDADFVLEIIKKIYHSCYESLLLSSDKCDERSLKFTYKYFNSLLHLPLFQNLRFQESIVSLIIQAFMNESLLCNEVLLESAVDLICLLVDKITIQNHSRNELCSISLLPLCDFLPVLIKEALFISNVIDVDRESKKDLLDRMTNLILFLLDYFSGNETHAGQLKKSASIIFGEIDVSCAMATVAEILLQKFNSRAIFDLFELLFKLCKAPSLLLNCEAINPKHLEIIVRFTGDIIVTLKKQSDQSKYPFLWIRSLQFLCRCSKSVTDLLVEFREYFFDQNDTLQFLYSISNRIFDQIVEITQVVKNFSVSVLSEIAYSCLLLSGSQRKHVAQFSMSFLKDVLLKELTSKDALSIEEKILEVIDRVSGEKGLSRLTLTYLDYLATLGEEDNLEESHQEVLFSLIKTMKQFIEFLLDIEELPSCEEYEEEKTLITFNLMQFMQRIKSSTIYLKYIHKLYTIQLSRSYYVEAGYALVLYFNILDWNGESGKIVQDALAPLFPIKQSSEERKELLAREICKCFNNAKCWELSLQILKLLAQRYESLYEYKKLASVMQEQSVLYSNIIECVRYYPEYFLVGYYGDGFPSCIRNQRFVFRGLEFEKLGAFCERLLNKHPNAKIINSDKMEEMSKKSPSMQVLQVIKLDVARSKEKTKTVEQASTLHQKRKSLVICNEATPMLCDRVPENIASFYENKDISMFSFSKPIMMKSTNKSPVEEFLNLWVEKTFVECEQSFPSLLRLSKVIRMTKQLISPIENAIKSVNEKSKELLSLRLKFTAQEDDKIQVNCSPLTMSLSGAIDAPVNGGITLYQQAFLCDDFVVSYPEHASSISILKSAIQQQVPMS